MADGGCNGAAGDPRFRRVGGAVQIYDNEAGTYVPYEPPQTFTIPQHTSSRSAPSHMSSPSNAAETPANAISHTPGGRVYSDVDDLDQFAPDPDVFSIPQRSAGYPRVIGGASAASSPASYSTERRVPTEHGSGLHSRSITTRTSRAPETGSRLCLPSGIVHHGRLQHHDKLGTAYAPQERGHVFKYATELDLHVEAYVDASNGKAAVVSFDATRMEEQLIDTIIAQSGSADRERVYRDMKRFASDALVHAIRVVSASNPTGVPLSITFPGHSGMSRMSTTLSPEPVFYVLAPSMPPTVIQHQVDLSHELHSPVMNMFAHHAGAVDLTSEYKRSSPTSTRCDVAYDSLLWAMAGTDPQSHGHWERINKNIEEHLRGGYVRDQTAADVARWKQMALVFLYEHLHIRPLIPRSADNKMHPEHNRCMHVRVKPLATLSNDGSNRIENASGLVTAHLKVLVCIPIQVSGAEWRKKYLNRLQEKGGVGFGAHAAPTFLFFNEGDGKQYQDLWTNYCANAPEASLHDALDAK